MDFDRKTSLEATGMVKIQEKTNLPSHQLKQRENIVQDRSSRNGRLQQHRLHDDHRKKQQWEKERLKK